MTTSVYFVLLIPITIDKNLVHVCLYYWYSSITILLFGPRNKLLNQITAIIILFLNCLWVSAKKISIK